MRGEPTPGDWTPGITDDVLLRRAATGTPPRDKRSGRPRWVMVMRRFHLGSTFANALCERLGLDPDEKVLMR